MFASLSDPKKEALKIITLESIHKKPAISGLKQSALSDDGYA